MLGNIILLFIIMYMCAKFPTFAGIVASIMTGAGIAITYFFAKSMFFYSPDDPSKLFNDQTMTLWFLSSLFLINNHIDLLLFPFLQLKYLLF